MSPEELLELSQRLSQEKLYTQAERESVAHLNHDVAVAAAQVLKLYRFKRLSIYSTQYLLTLVYNQLCCIAIATPKINIYW